jgi:hypothetical protein
VGVRTVMSSALAVAGVAVYAVLGSLARASETIVSPRCATG